MIIMWGDLKNVSQGFDKIKNLSHNELNQAVKYAERSPLPKIKDIKRNVYAL